MERSIVDQWLSEEAKQALMIELADQVTSTNDLLKEAAQKSAPHGSVLAAAMQTKGKGRRGRSFFSPEDTGLYLSILLRPSMEAQDALAVTTMAAVSAAVAIEKLLKEVTGENLTCQIKWVNDLLLRERKIVGILTEGAFTGGKTVPDYLVMGIGFNVWEPKGGFPEELRSIAGAIMPGKSDVPVNLKGLGNGSPDREGELASPKREGVREQLIALFLNEFIYTWNTYEKTGKREYMDSYRERSCVLGKTVTMLNADHLPVEGEPPVRVVAIGDEAELIVEYPDGKRRSLSSGEISVRSV